MSIASRGHSIVDVRENGGTGELIIQKLLPKAKWLINDNAGRFVLSGAGIALLPTHEGERWRAGRIRLT